MQSVTDSVFNPTFVVRNVSPFDHTVLTVANN